VTLKVAPAKQCDTPDPCSGAYRYLRRMLPRTSVRYLHTYVCPFLNSRVGKPTSCITTAKIHLIYPKTSIAHS
jgi:hypothetical protein